MDTFSKPCSTNSFMEASRMAFLISCFCFSFLSGMPMAFKLTPQIYLTLLSFQTNHHFFKKIVHKSSLSIHIECFSQKQIIQSHIAKSAYELIGHIPYICCIPWRSLLFQPVSIARKPLIRLWDKDISL